MFCQLYRCSIVRYVLSALSMLHRQVCSVSSIDAPSSGMFCQLYRCSIVRYVLSALSLLHRQVCSVVSCDASSSGMFCQLYPCSIVRYVLSALSMLHRQVCSVSSIDAPSSGMFCQLYRCSIVRYVLSALSMLHRQVCSVSSITAPSSATATPQTSGVVTELDDDLQGTEPAKAGTEAHARCHFTAASSILHSLISETPLPSRRLHFRSCVTDSVGGEIVSRLMSMSSDSVCAMCRERAVCVDVGVRNSSESTQTIKLLPTTPQHFLDSI
ncbi:hypothetical protein J6590_037939 [Homalodisca vitripennis]|nr:hypothetical protein J6590_037939 [Homalodisca vitripennis]